MKTNYLQNPTRRTSFIKRGAWTLAVLLIVFFAGDILLSFVFRMNAGVGGAIVRTTDRTSSLFGFIGSYFSTRNALETEIAALSDDLSLARLSVVREEDLARENTELRALLSRGPKGKHGILAEVLVRPPSSPYDTMIVDAGFSEGANVGDLVIADGFVVGEITRTTSHTSIVTLWSQSGNTFDVSVGTTFSGRAEGEGGGDFYIRAPRDTHIQEGDIVRAPSLGNAIVGTVGVVVLDDTDPFAEIYVASPLNLRTIRFVEIVRTDE